MNYWEQQRQIEKRNTIIIVSVIVGIVISVVVGLWLTFRTREAHYQVVGAQWIATTNIRQKTQRHGEDWCPPDESSAFNIKRERRLHHTYKCHCVTIGKDPTDPSSTGVEVCSTCEDYRDYCIYDYWDWPVIKTRSNMGKPEAKPVHPIIPFEPPNQRGEMITTFPVVWTNEENESKSYQARSLDELRKYNLGDWWAINVNHAGKFEPQRKLFGEGQ